MNLVIDQGLGHVADLKQVFKALFGARDKLLEELQKLSKAINQTIDLTDFISKLSDTKLFSTSLQADGVTTSAQASGQVSGEPQSGLEVHA